MRRPIWARPVTVTALYLVLAVVATWPLVTVMHRRVAGDLGDPLFNSWVLLWTSGQALRALGGHLSALSQYWNAPIFYPAPLTLAYSEHLTPLMLQSLPVFAATGNIVLCYNVLLLGTIVLSGLGMYLLVRELTGQPLAAFLAGLAFAFAPFRVDQFAHIEVLSSQWMPFTLYGFRRFFVTGRLRPLVGGAGALVAQGLSCGYYLAYFTPFAVAYCLYEMAVRGTIGDGRTWRALVGAGGAALLVVAVFLWPYFRVRQVGDVGVRGSREIELFSADTYAFGTISEHAALWGRRVRALPHVEGQGFPGFAILAFAAAGVGIGLARAIAHARVARVRTAWWRRALTVALGAILLLLLLLLGHALVTGRVGYSVAGMFFSHRTTSLIVRMAIAVVALVLTSPLFRRVVRGVPGSTLAFFACAAVAAAWMSLGPIMHANGRTLGPGLYYVFYRWVPGFDGLRVPSRNFMIVAFFLSILAGLGAAALLSRWRVGRLLVVLGMIAIMAESWSVPTEANAPLAAYGYRLPPAEIAGSRELSPIYVSIRDARAGSVVAEFPFGDIAYEIQYTFYSGYHRKPIVNGFSGFFPSGYTRLLGRLSQVPLGPEAWTALLEAGVTHAVVHEGAYFDEDGRGVSAWLRRHGAHEITAFQTDRLFQLR